MKLYNYILLLVAITFLPDTALMAQTLSSPESIVYYKSKEIFLVSNSQDGSVLARDRSGNLSFFIPTQTNLTSPKGLVILNDTLYIADLGSLVIYSIAQTPVFVKKIDLPGAVFLNDICVDSSHQVYLSDNMTSSLFHYNIYTGKGEKMTLNGPEPDSPNGIIFDQDQHRLITVGFNDQGKIQSVNLDSMSITNIRVTNYANLDGLTKDKSGNYYVSGWGLDFQTGKIYKFNSDFSKDSVFATGLLGPADILFNNADSYLYIPEMSRNRIVGINTLTGVSVDNLPETDLIEIYPNPVSDKSTFKLNGTFNHADIVLYNSLGMVVATFAIDGTQSDRLNISRAGLSSGAYLLRATIDSKTLSKMIIIE